MTNPQPSGFDAEKYHFSLWPVVAWFTSITVCLFLYGVLMLQANRGFDDAIRIASRVSLAVGLFFAACVLIIAIYNKLVPTRVGPDGIDTYNGLGLRTRVRWDEITRVSKITLFPGFSFLWLHHGENIFTAAYVALFLLEPAKFYRTAASYAGPDHPLTQAYARYAK